jgi:hypothetical protein
LLEQRENTRQFVEFDHPLVKIDREKTGIGAPRCAELAGQNGRKNPMPDDPANGARPIASA